ncbi:LacI family DNA-binding transcriptional regulator [Arthrobacter sp. ov407]|uniref:LacI family DNA-binding transcriptional regulator n=1 Tax=Arthrobacter sp. ov407 TaxID=1761748 RepID=UPI001C40928F
MRIQDVAALCGLSIGTVSRALRRLPSVSAQAKARVGDARPSWATRPRRQGVRFVSAGKRVHYRNRRSSDELVPGPDHYCPASGRPGRFRRQPGD